MVKPAVHECVTLKAWKSVALIIIQAQVPPLATEPRNLNDSTTSAQTYETLD